LEDVLSNKVSPIEEMSDDTLVKHYNARHMPMAGWTEIKPYSNNDGQRVLRAYHKHVHSHDEQNHTHRDSRETT